jgi:hypothetical protein
MFDQRLNQLSAQIAKMTPPQRQQFAMLHKNDPILVSLTKFVNDQENATRNALKAESVPEAVNQPKVVDQTIASMTGPMITEPPRAQPGPGAGLPALDAPNLASMPDGGIAGQPEEAPSYAGGGMVQHFQSGGMPYEDLTLYSQMPGPRHFGSPRPPAGEDTIQRAIAEARGYAQSMGQPFGPAEEEGVRARFAEDFGQSARHMAPPAPGPRGKPQSPAAPQQGIAAVAPPTAAAAPAKPDPDAEIRELVLGELGYSRKDGKWVKGTPAAGGGAGAPGGGLPALPKPMDVSAEYDASMKRLGDMPPTLQKRLDSLAEARAALADERSNAVDARWAELGEAGKAREERLKGREGKLAQDEKTNFNMGLLTAGLAMLSETGPNGLANIGKGAMVGVKQWEQGKARLDAARDKIEEQMFALETERRGEAKERTKDKLEARLGKRAAAVESMAEATRAVQEMYGVNAKVASGLVEAAVRQSSAYVEAAARERNAHITGRYEQAKAGTYAGAARVTGLLGLLKDGRANDASYFRARQLAIQQIKADPSTRMLVEGSQEFNDAVDRITQQLVSQSGGVMPQSASSAAPVVPPVKIIGVRPN